MQRNVLAASLRGLRDLWIVLGITLLLFGLIEAAYNGQRALRISWFGSDDQREAEAPGHPYAGQAWYRDFLAAREGGREKYDPWRGYWAYETRSAYLNVDPAGYRVTVQPAVSSSAPRRVYLLGASAMWGYSSRDSMTIPSLVAAGLRASGMTDIEVVNLAQPGYTLGYEAATLNRELVTRGAPALAVFFDGLNDIRTTHLNREPGHAFFERRFGHLYERESQRGFFTSFVTPGERSKVVARLVLALGLDNTWEIPPRRDDACPKLGRYYRDMSRTVEGVAKAWGFDVLFVQQPNHATTRKPLTPFERSIMGPKENVDYTRECAEAIDTEMGAAHPANFISMGNLFDDVKETVYLDLFGHVTEEANRRIAGILVREVAARLSKAPVTNDER